MNASLLRHCALILATVVSGACAGASNSETPRPSGAGASTSGETVASHPSRADVVAALREIAPAGNQCMCPGEGVLAVSIVLQSDGTVRRASVPSEGPMGNANSVVEPEVTECVLRAARAMRVPPFEDEEMTVGFPFRCDQP